jgi:hypothetical protein
MPIINLTTSFLGIIPPNNPVVTFVSATGDSITVNITNPNEYSVKAYYGHTNPNPTLNTIISANSNQNVTVSGLTGGTNYTIYVYLENTENNSKSATVSVLASTPAELYAFTSQNFTNAGVTGRTGPNLTQCRNAYSSASWTQNNSFFNMTTNGIQLWTVPVSATYRIEVWGAQAGRDENNRAGGLGARMRGDFSLTQGDVIAILVGQKGWDAPVPGQCHHRSGMGGGGSFVWLNSSNSLLIAAGGGGGGVYCGLSANDINGSSSIGNGAGSSDTAGGAGWASNGGVTGTGSHIAALRPLQGGTGGQSTGDSCGGSQTKLGGFGGGAANGQYNNPCAGGGGYQGGGDGRGGLSFNNGTNQSNSSGVRTDAGQVTITKL